jgi:GalNAc-alpha-(1->4)-GalNAc-alpha-(1->3)-diNAcBac-PP-undecaprenol alpha-1,4-N-acetyl-D-galactosaminyltransferase
MLKKKILLVNFALTPGGTERHLSELANHLASEGYRIYFLLLRKERIFFELDRQIQIIEPGYKYKNSKTGKFLYFLRIINFIRKNIKNLNPDLILNTAFPFFFILSTFGLRNPVIISIRCDPGNIKLIEGIKIPVLFRKMVYNKRVKAIIAQTTFARNVLSSQFNKAQIVTIPNFLKNNPVVNRERENIVISAGRLKKSKGFNYLIEAFNVLKPSDWKLVILGEGPEKESLNDMIGLYKLEDKVSILEYSTNIHEYYANSKVFAFTSLTEGFPNVLLEAMATPLACISFDINSGPREIISDGVNGFLVEAGDLNNYAAKLRLLMGDESLRKSFMAEAIKIRETYGWNNIRKQYIELIESLSN